MEPPLQEQPQPQQPPALPPFSHPHFPPASVPTRSASSTPMSSPGLFNPSARHNLPPTSVSSSSTPAPTTNSPFLHPLQTHRVRETHKALIDSDNINGRKSINQYEVIQEIGRGMHGKVKLARDLEKGDNVAIKIIPRFSKKRRLGKVTAKSQQDKTKKEIAILKKIRHPNVVALLEVIDDPELKKIYMVLEHVELGEIVWRKKGLPHVCQYERRRTERETYGLASSLQERQYDELLERRQAIKEVKRARMAQHYAGPSDYWSVEHGAADEISSSLGRWSRISSRDDFANTDGTSSAPGSRRSSVCISRSHSAISSAEGPAELDEAIDWEDEMETPGPNLSAPNAMSALEGTMYGAYDDDGDAMSFKFRGRSPSMADSIISHMSSVDYNPRAHDPFADDFSYVPCFTFEQARSAFRDTVLGLEYLHYQGVVHRDIKPANLLWSKEHRVKISDFGVSYFGRPIREGEPEDLVSESEAKDFDDDLELAKTVGTPAFFAPELCYTDLDKEQPKVSEQIDVWSLGVTLYCLIYARIPFLAEDEFQMFRKIANEDVHIPRRRLRPVDPSTSPATQSLYKRQNSHPYRHDNDIEYEDVDNLLYDLLRQMLTKNPEKRIRLRDIKRHPWVVQGIKNPVGWLDDTDPARPSCGRKIQVDEREMSSAVVPLTFLERARSVVKKAVGKVMHPLVERSDSRSRRRATSSAASSAGDSMFKNLPNTPQQRGERRSSLRIDDYFANAARDALSSTDQGSSANVTTVPAPETIPYDPLATVLSPVDQSRVLLPSRFSDAMRDGRHSASPRSSHRHGHSHGKLGHQFLSLSPQGPISQTMPSTPACHSQGSSYERTDGVLRMTDDPQSSKDDMSRSFSVDRALFASADKRAPAQVAVTTAVAPGNTHSPRYPIPMRSVDLGRGRYGYGASSPLSSSPQSATASRYQHSQPHSDPSLHGVHEKLERLGQPPESLAQPQSATQTTTLPLRHPTSTSPESCAQVTESSLDKPGLHLSVVESPIGEVDPANVPCPPSPTKVEWSDKPETLFRGNTMTTAKSSSTDSMEVLGTPLTSPSEAATSPVGSLPAKSASERMLAFQSDPSLPALLSGASSISADLEGELLGRPGVINTQTPVLESADSLTPPAMPKEPVAGFPLDQVFENPPAMDSGTLNLQLHASRPHTPEPSHSQALIGIDGQNDDDDDNDDSDGEILVMAKPKRRSPSKPPSPTSTVSRTPRLQARRRDTNISVASTETAKKVSLNGDEPTTWL